MNNDVLEALLDSMEQRESVALLSVTEATGAFAGSLGSHCLLWLDEARAPVGDLALPELMERIQKEARRALQERKHRHVDYATDEGSVKIFVEVQARAPHLIIVGAGHIAVPLAASAKLCDFEVTVLDDRPQYAHPARFPTADRVIAGPFRAELNNLRPEGAHGEKLPFDNHTYIVMVTRGHQYDVESLLEVLDDPLAYVGMIGSRRRVRAVFELLEQEQGIPPHKFDRVHAPIGIDIGAITPAEIAVCIMAEIINVLRAGPAVGISEQIRRERLDRRERVQARAEVGNR
jgi:xanthine dehydrogenase accessory factor